MRYRPLPIPPPVSLSTRASGFLRLPTLFRVAANAGIDAIDLDLSGRLGRPAADQIARLVDDAGVHVNAVWVPQVGAGPWINRRREAATRGAVLLARATLASTLVVEAPPGGGLCSRSAVGYLGGAVRDEIGEDIRVAIAVRAHQLEGGRGHLAQLGTLRRLVEEWELDLALDLLGPIDPRWEVEAALSRLAPRLAVIRVGSFARQAAVRGRARMMARVLAASLDAGFGGSLAVAPPVPVWQTGWAPALVRAAAETDELVRTRYAAIYEHPAYDSSPDQRLRS